MDYNWLFNVVLASRCQTLVEFELLICNIPLLASVKQLPICSLSLIITAHLVKSIIGILLPDLRHFNSSIIPHWGLMTLEGRWAPAGGRDRPPRTAGWSSSSSAASYRLVWYCTVWCGLPHGVVWWCAHCRTLGSRFRCLCRINIPTDLSLLPMLSIHISCQISTNFCLHSHSSCFCFQRQMDMIANHRDGGTDGHSIRTCTTWTDWLLCDFLKQTLKVLLSAVDFPLRYFWAPPPNSFVPWENLSPRTLLLFVQSSHLCICVWQVCAIMSTPPPS